MTTMSIRNFLSTAVRLPRETAVLLRGEHGIGKSRVIRTLSESIRGTLQAKDPKVKYPIIDRRLSQMTEGDMIGLPSTDGSTTRFNPPDWVKKACDEPCVLFLDELNRATPEVMQAAFQIVLDRELNGWHLHPDTRVYAAINNSASYIVNEMDPALLDRFWTVDLTPTVEDWLLWARSDGAIHGTVVDFIATNEKWLDVPKNAEPGKKGPSRRSWERLSNALVSAGVADTPEDQLFYSMCLGYVGTEATIAFQSYAKTVDSQVTGEEILSDYAKARAKVQRLGQEKQNVLIDKVVEHVKKTMTLPDEEGVNLKAFVEDVPAELRVSLWTKLQTAAGGASNMTLAQRIHKWVSPAVLAVYGVKTEEVDAPAKAPATEKKEVPATRARKAKK